MRLLEFPDSAVSVVAECVKLYAVHCCRFTNSGTLNYLGLLLDSLVGGSGSKVLCT